jgi:EpsD family peptidyl-prolyl cis-trans isomerase
MKLLADKLQNYVPITLVLSLCAVALLGCGKKSDDRTEAPPSQIVARVGNEVITAQELDNEFRLANVPADKRKDSDAVKRVLGDLVTRKYLVGQAIDAKLDREPTVLTDMLRARELVLANAVASRDVMTKSSAISKSDVENYIANNPLKFANRQLITVEQITFPLSSNSQLLVDTTKDSKTLDEVDQKLTAMPVPHNRSMGAIYSGEVPADLYNLIQARKEDDVFFIRSGSNGVYFKVKSQETRPLEGENAINVARQYLRLDLMKTEAGMAGVAANLEAKYEGEYAKLMMSPEPSQPAVTK